MSNAVSNASRGASAIRFDPYQVRPLPSPNSATNLYAPWILLSESMTLAIGETLGAMPRVSPGFEGPGQLAPWESRLLGLHGNRGYAREVMLSVRDRPVLAARTVSRLDDPALELIRKLGERPLAQLLFEDRDWRRASAPFGLIELGYRRIGRTCLWRRDQGRGRGNSSLILVTEFFEPGQLVPYQA